MRRRTFVGTAASVLFAGLPPGWAGGVYREDGPETRDIRIGVSALTDSTPIVIAHERGYFSRFGINAIVSKDTSWAVIRDKLWLGEHQAAQMLLGMPLAATMGLAGARVKPMVIPWLLNRNGQAITLSNGLKAAGASTPAAIKPLADAANARGEPLTFAMTFPYGTHAMWLRYWLASGGVHPDRDVDLIAIPPAQMVASMKAGRMDGFCAAESWNRRAMEEGAGFTAVTSSEIWRDHPEQVCAFTEEFAAKNPKTVKAVLKALRLASGDPDASYPHQIYGTWWLTQFRRWGMVEKRPAYTAMSKRVLRSDIYVEAMRELGVEGTVAEEQTITLFDGTFDGKDPEKYARSFPGS